MAYTTTTRLLLKKAVPGTNQPFETAEINANWDKVDAEAVAVDARLDAVEASTAGLPALTSRVTAVEGVNTTQDGRLTTAEGNITTINTRLNTGVVNNATKWNGRAIYVQGSAPTSGMVTGDIWIQA